jgi:hypothetical protein
MCIRIHINNIAYSAYPSMFELDSNVQKQKSSSTMRCYLWLLTLFYLINASFVIIDVITMARFGFLLPGSFFGIINTYILLSYMNC